MPLIFWLPFLVVPYITVAYWRNRDHVEVGKHHCLSYQKPFPLDKMKRVNWETVDAVDLKKTVLAGRAFPTIYTPRVCSGHTSHSLGLSFSSEKRALQVKKELEDFFNVKVS